MSVTFCTTFLPKTDLLGHCPPHFGVARCDHGIVYLEFVALAILLRTERPFRNCLRRTLMPSHIVYAASD